MEYITGTKVFGDWEIVGELGEGSFGKVFKIRKTEYGISVLSALKVIRVPRSVSDIRAVLSEGMDEQSATAYFQGVVDEIVKEVAVMSALKSHPNIVSCEDYKVIPHAGEIGWDILIRMELLTALTDYQMNHAMDRAAVCRLGTDICSALVFCQKKGLIHRDIKPENIFVDERGQFKLGDFGVARTVERTAGGLSKKGTDSYMAPEVYLGKPYGPSVDLYSLGLVLYRFMNGNRLPFFPPAPKPITFADRENALAMRIQGTPVPAPSQADPAFAGVILKACAYWPGERYETAAQMLEALSQAAGQTGEEPAPPRPEAVLQPEPAPQPGAADSGRTMGAWGTPPCPEAVPQPEPAPQPGASDSGRTMGAWGAPPRPEAVSQPEPAPQPESTPRPAAVLRPGGTGSRLLLYGALLITALFMFADIMAFFFKTGDSILIYSYSAAILFLIPALFLGLGSFQAVSGFMSAGRGSDAKAAGRASMIFSVILAAVLTPAAFLFRNLYISLIVHAFNEEIVLYYSYLSVFMLPSMLLTTAAAGVLLGLGDRKKPALILLAAGAVHLLALFMLSPSDNRIVTVNKTGLISMFYWLLNAVVMVIAAAVRLSGIREPGGRGSFGDYLRVIIKKGAPALLSLLLFAAGEFAVHSVLTVTNPFSSINAFSGFAALIMIAMEFCPLSGKGRGTRALLLYAPWALIVLLVFIPGGRLEPQYYLIGLAGLLLLSVRTVFLGSLRAEGKHGKAAWSVCAEAVIRLIGCPVYYKIFWDIGESYVRAAFVVSLIFYLIPWGVSCLPAVVLSRKEKQVRG